MSASRTAHRLRRIGRRLLLLIARIHSLRSCRIAYGVLFTFFALLFAFLYIRADSPPNFLQWSPTSAAPVKAPMPHLAEDLRDVDPPDSRLYGKGPERCYSLGDNGMPLWHMNSRAMCFNNAPVCLSGNRLQELYTFAPRGSGSCDVVRVSDVQSHGAFKRMDKIGMKESCATWRKRHVISMYGIERFVSWNSWMASLSKRHYRDPHHHPATWHSDFAIIVPKYEWSWNICHYNRIWNYIIFTIRNLKTLAPEVHGKINRVDVLFRSGLTYEGHWPRGVREATLPALEAETGLEIRVGRIRYDSRRDFQCVRKSILLGAEGRVDAFPFLNDTDVWKFDAQQHDTHWPTIPGDSLWFRQATFSTLGLPNAGTFDGPGIGIFRSVPVPPKRIVVLVRSPRSRRRLTFSGTKWLQNAIAELAAFHGFEIRYVRFVREMTLRTQIEAIHDAGVAIGLHGANMVNTMFMPAGAAMFEIFPWRYVRFYYAGGSNSGLRYSFHEPQAGIDRHCRFDRWCFMRYRESTIYLSEKDRAIIRMRIENALKYVTRLHERFPNGSMPLTRIGNVYHIPRESED